MRLFSYTVVRDFGFAPNPFGGVCTLATCKPHIRKMASPGDWVIGTGSVGGNLRGRLIYAMKVDEKLSFEDYWIDPRFQVKKPTFASSLKHSYGDNIYHKDPLTGMWLQEDSHHSNQDGSLNLTNCTRDTMWPLVLVSFNYYYYGSSHIQIPDELASHVCHNQRFPPQRIVEDRYARRFLSWLGTKERFVGTPIGFANGFSRFEG